MSVSFRQLHPAFAGEVSGIDCSKPLSREEVTAVEAGMVKYAVWCSEIRTSPTSSSWQ